MATGFMPFYQGRPCPYTVKILSWNLLRQQSYSKKRPSDILYGAPVTVLNIDRLGLVPVKLEPFRL